MFLLRSLIGLPIHVDVVWPSKLTALLKVMRWQLPSAKHHLIGMAGFSEEVAEGFLQAAQSKAVAHKGKQSYVDMV